MSRRDIVRPGKDFLHISRCSLGDILLDLLYLSQRSKYRLGRDYTVSNLLVYCTVHMDTGLDLFNLNSYNINLQGNLKGGRYHSKNLLDTLESQTDQ